MPETWLFIALRYFHGDDLMKPLPLDALSNYSYLSRPTFSPSGRTAAFVVKKADMKENGYTSVLYMVRFPEAGVTAAAGTAQEVRQLTSLGKESSFLYDSDNTLLLPLNRRKEDEPEKNHFKTVFYRLPLDGGEAIPAFDVPYEVGTIKKVRDGLYAFSSEIDLNRPDPDGEDKDQLDDYEDYHVLEEIPYWTDNGGFISRFRNHLFLYDEKKKETKCITDGLFRLDHFECYNGRLVFSGATFSDLPAYESGLFEYDFEKGEVKTLIPEGKHILSSFAMSNDHLWVMAMPEGTKDYWGLFSLYEYRDGELKLLCDQMPEIEDGPMSDSVMGYSPAFIVRDEKLYFSALIRTKSLLFRLRDGAAGSGAQEKAAGSAAAYAAPAAGTETAFLADTIYDGKIALQGFDVHEEALLFTGMREGCLQELYLRTGKSGRIRQLTHFNDEAIRDCYIAKPKYIPYTNSYGIRIDGWIMAPIDMDPEKTYPGILNIHGGPRGAYGTTFFNEMQYWAGQGYYVLFCNPQGSAGRGDSFADLRKKYGTIDYHDLMEFVDHALDVTPNLDKDRLGVTGGSYGGWMTNWILGHTDRFKAACSQRSFSNWLSDFSASEIGFTFDPIEIGGIPWEDPMRLWENSPAAYVDKIVTPTLFIHSLLDHNCPLSESMQIFTAMRYRHIPARAVLFEGEGHGLSRGGKPKHRIRRIKEITEWMDKYLKPAEDPAGSVQNSDS